MRDEMKLDMYSTILAVSSPMGLIHLLGDGKPYYHRSLGASLMVRNTHCSCVSKIYRTRICDTDYVVYPIQDIPWARIKQIAKSVDLKAVSRKRMILNNRYIENGFIYGFQRICNNIRQIRDKVRNVVSLWWFESPMAREPVQTRIVYYDAWPRALPP